MFEVQDLSDFDPTQAGDLAQVPENVRLTMRTRGLEESYYLASTILGYDMLRPRTHGPLCIFLDTCKTKRRLIQMPRSHFKTTIVTVTLRIQDYLKDPNIRILITGNSGPNTIKHLSKIRGQFETNNLFRWLYPDRVWEDTSQAPLWSRESLILPRTALHGEPTFDSIGAGGAVVSRHYDVINPDDIIGEEEAYSDAEMAKTIEWFTGLESLFVPPIDEGQLDIPSTYWRVDDVYAFAESYFGMGQEKVETGPYSYRRGNIAVFRRGAIEEGEPIFPEAVSLDFLSRLQEKNPERYAAQYANNPYAEGVAYFHPNYLKYYNWRIQDRVIRIHDEVTNKTEFVRLDGLYIVGLCDPHAGGSTSRFRAGGRAAVLTTGVHAATGRVFLLDCWIKRAATNLIIDEIFRQNEKWGPQLFSIEANGLQKMLKFWIDERTERYGAPSIPYLGFIPKGDKHGDRRIKGLQPLFRAGQIFVQRGHTELIDEYLAWPRGAQDGMDALSQGLEFWNVGYDAAEDEMMQAYELRMREMRSVATGY